MRGMEPVLTEVTRSLKIVIALNPQLDIEWRRGKGLGKLLVPEAAWDTGLLQHVPEQPKLGAIH